MNIQRGEAYTVRIYDESVITKRLLLTNIDQQSTSDAGAERLSCTPGTHALTTVARRPSIGAVRTSTPDYTVPYRAFAVIESATAVRVCLQ